MTSAVLALEIVNLLLLIVVVLSQIEIVTKVSWLKNVLIPFLVNLSRFINPDKK